jgi:pimeloyl-ACP methyl ester carboxylesterase/DNA-binding CsgD family transcriptional regulator
VLVLVPGLTSHLEVQWEDPAYRSFVRRLSRSARVIRFDKRGTGLSDPVRELPTLDERTADLAAVLDAATADSAVLFGYSEGGPISIKFAVERPSALAGLVLYGTSARNPPPWAIERLSAALDAWGTGSSIDLFAPSLADDSRARSDRGRLERASASPAMARALVSSLAMTDVRPLLDRLEVPTLVLHRCDEFVPVDEARYLASRIRRAELIELPGRDHIPWVGDSDSVVNEVERFLSRVIPLDVDRRSRRNRGPARRPTRPVVGWASLTPREETVALLLAEGASNIEIAQRLFISPKTVETHVKHIFAKLGVDSRASVAGSAARLRQPNT